MLAEPSVNVNHLLCPVSGIAPLQNPPTVANQESLALDAIKPPVVVISSSIGNTAVEAKLAYGAQCAQTPWKC
jgi:hypothetical protein